jgi:uncharacterized pyridoxamine 5'-phosphate oxidase family protein
MNHKCFPKLEHKYTPNQQKKQIYNGKDKETNIHVAGTDQAYTLLLVTSKIVFTVTYGTCFT